MPESVIISSEEKPIRRATRIVSLVGLPVASVCSIRTTLRIFSRKKGAISVSFATSSTENPTLNASKMHPNRSSVGFASSIRISGSEVWGWISVSRDRIAFLNASSSVRPMAITSPVDFIAVVSVRSAFGNLSNGHRGTFTTT